MVTTLTDTLKLHLGCGERYLPGWVHVDVRPLPGIDYVSAIDQLPMFADGSVDEIYNCHVLEHFGRHTFVNALQEWFRLLKPGGILRTAVPDLEACMALYGETGDITLIHGLIYGRQDYPENTHYIGFDFRFLKQKLEEVGFTDVRRYDWADVLPEGYDDYSRAYTQGKLMSLNIEACKP